MYEAFVLCAQKGTGVYAEAMRERGRGDGAKGSWRVGSVRAKDVMEMG